MFSEIRNITRIITEIYMFISMHVYELKKNPYRQTITEMETYSRETLKNHHHKQKHDPAYHIDFLKKILFKFRTCLEPTTYVCWKHATGRAIELARYQKPTFSMIDLSLLLKGTTNEVIQCTDQQFFGVATGTGYEMLFCYAFFRS